MFKFVDPRLRHLNVDYVYRQHTFDDLDMIHQVQLQAQMEDIEKFNSKCNEFNFLLDIYKKLKERLPLYDYQWQKLFDFYDKSKKGVLDLFAITQMLKDAQATESRAECNFVYRAILNRNLHLNKPLFCKWVLYMNDKYYKKLIYLSKPTFGMKEKEDDTPLSIRLL